MGRRVAVVGKTPTWRRGMSAILSDAGSEPVEFDDIAAWKPGRGGAAAIVGISDTSDLESISVFHEEYPQIPVVAVLDDMSLASFAAVVRAGALVAVGEHESAEVISSVLEAAFQLHAAVPESLIRSLARRVPDTPAADAWVEPGEAGWLQSLARGDSVASIAEAVGYSEREMFRMLRDLYLRIGVRNRTEAIVWAAQHLLTGDDPVA